jgi:hypothetical protein
MEIQKKLKEFKKLYEKIKVENEGTKKDNLLIKFNELFIHLIKLSKEENYLFSSSPIEVYKEFILNSIDNQKETEIVFDEVNYLKNKLEINHNVLRTESYHTPKPIEHYFYVTELNRNNYNLFKDIIRQRIDFIEEELFLRGYEVKKTFPYGDTSVVRITYVKHPDKIEIYKNKIKEKEYNRTTEKDTKSESKSLIFQGKPLNLYERYTIANKLLDIGNKIHTLNISQAKKNELLSYILGCNIDNAKKILNGTYNNKKRDLTDLFNDLGLNK